MSTGLADAMSTAPHPHSTGATDTLRVELAAAAQRLAARGSCPATSSNFSARLPDGRVLMSASGIDKATLGPADFLVLGTDGRPAAGTPPSVRPSAETALHLLVYARTDAEAVLHAHPVSATVLSLAHQQDGAVRFAGLELVKAFRGVDTHEHEEVVPIVSNGQDMVEVAEAVSRHFDAAGAPHAFMLAGHGYYTWGRSVAEALRHAEALESLCECVLRLAQWRAR